MKELFKEESFYSTAEGPAEEYTLCLYHVDVTDERVGIEDYDQFAIIENALYPYIRLTKRRGNHHFPCGGSLSPATDGYFARKTEKERDELCPKIAWGFAAVFISELRYDYHQRDYVALKDRDFLIKSYYDKYWQLYLQCHNGLKYRNISNEQKELDFLIEHETVIRAYWEKSIPLAKYHELFEYAKNAEEEYEKYLSKRKKELYCSIKEKAVNPDCTNQVVNCTIVQKGDKSVYIEKNSGVVNIN